MTPVTVLTGFLGAGKTTLVRDAFRFRPDPERWAVVVNERGTVGIDGALLAGAGVTVREVAGGCVCCTAGVELRAALVSILRQVRPDRLFIEPSGVARPEAVLDALRASGVREVVAPRSTLCALDARRLADPRILRSDAFLAQFAAADRVVGTHAAAQTADSRRALASLVSSAWPPKRELAWTDGAFDELWLDETPGTGLRFSPGSGGGEDLHEAGTIWGVDAIFDTAALEGAVQALVQPGLLPEGVARIKGLFRTNRGWRQLDGTSIELRWTPTGWRSDSRVEILAPVEPPSGWALIWTALQAALVSG